MATLRGIINGRADNNLASGEGILRLELALIKDAGEPITSFCNFFEGDGFIAPYASDSWNSLNNHLRVVVNRYTERNCPSTCREIVMEIAEGSEELQQALMEVTVAKAITVMEKLESDSLTRFRDTLQILRGCRLLGYQFVKERGAHGGD